VFTSIGFSNDGIREDGGLGCSYLFSTVFSRSMVVPTVWPVSSLYCLYSYRSVLACGRGPGGQERRHEQTEVAYAKYYLQEVSETWTCIMLQYLHCFFPYQFSIRWCVASCMIYSSVPGAALFRQLWCPPTGMYIAACTILNSLFLVAFV
jgi:hypothetical protein